MGLSGVIGTSVPVVAILAGPGGWLTWAIAAVIIMFVALSIPFWLGASPPPVACTASRPRPSGRSGAW